MKKNIILILSALILCLGTVIIYKNVNKEISINGWYKHNKVYWKDNTNIGEHIFSFDMKKEYNLFSDFPYKLTPEEVDIFIESELYWAEYFEIRIKEYKKK